jgi:hypothetical protein
MSSQNDNPLKRTAISPKVQTKTGIKSLLEERMRQDAEIKPMQILEGEDKGVTAHSETPANAEFSDKLYFFPESYNALRTELSTHWPTLWAAVGWNMAFKAEDFIADMNAALELKLQFDSQKVEVTCATYLNELRRLRGLSGFKLPGNGG